jgi:tripartite-type tricarboxylate transporter receptor subunit TctC
MQPMRCSYVKGVPQGYSSSVAAMIQMPTRNPGDRAPRGIKTISLYVSFPPGGGYDIYARVLAPHAGQ